MSRLEPDSIDSAGILLYRRGDDGRLEVLIAHPGGPFWARRDRGAWSIPKGEPDPGEDPLAAARREFAEETGMTPPLGPAIPLGVVAQRGGKRVAAWAIEGDLDPDTVHSNTITIEWPPGTGRTLEIPEIDRVAWVTVDEAREKLNPAQAAFLDRLQAAFDRGE